MMAHRKKGPHPGGGTLPRLAPEAEAGLQEMLLKVARALEEGWDQEALLVMLAPATGNQAWDLGLIEALGALAHPGVPGLLSALFGNNPDKSRRKALKKAFHLLKSRGVPAADALLPREEATALRAGARTSAKAYISQVLGSGQRYVILEGPREVLGGNFLVAQVSDREGIQECAVLDLKSRQRREFWDHLKEQGLSVLAAPFPAYAVRLLEEADALQPGSEGGSRYRSLKSRIRQEWGRPEEAQEEEALLPPLSPGEHSRLLDQSRDLVRDPLFFSWLPSPREIEPWLQKMQEVQDSPLVLSEPQKMARLDDVLGDAVIALYPPETRDLWRGRVLAMAYFLDLLGRGPESRLALAAAMDLAGGPRGPLAGENPLLKALVQAGLSLAWEFEAESRQEEEPSSSLLAPPTESLLIRR
jgi:hypothetical protein